jgi:Bacterial regulatory proteins, tetR family
VVAAAAGLADEIGYQGVTMGLLADRLGVRPPSLYKHVSGLASRGFQWEADPGQTFAWMIGFIDRGLRPAC